MYDSVCTCVLQACQVVLTAFTLAQITAHTPGNGRKQGCVGVFISARSLACLQGELSSPQHALCTSHSMVSRAVTPVARARPATRGQGSRHPAPLVTS
jgi:hypothetical protein